MRKTTFLSIGAILFTTGMFAQPTWQQAQTTTKMNYSLASVNNTGRIFAYADGELLSGDSTGDNWETITTLPPMGGTSGQIFGHKKYLFMVDMSGSNGRGIFRSSDGGATWTQKNSGLLGLDTTNIRGIISFGTDLVAIHNGSSVDKIFYSDDDGDSWYAGLNMFSQAAITVVESSGRLYLITTGTVYETNDGFNWNNLNATMPPTGSGMTVALSDGTFLMVSDTSLYISANKGVSWTQKTVTGFPADTKLRTLIKSPASDTLYVATETPVSSAYGIYYSPDKGATWALCNTGLPSNAQIVYDGQGQHMHIAYNGYMFVSANNGTGIYRSTMPVTASRALGINNIAKKDIGLNIFPNPATDKLDITIAQQGFGIYTVKVMDITGKTLMQTQHTGNAALNISPLVKGTYFINISNGQWAVTDRFVKQ